MRKYLFASVLIALTVNSFSQAPLAFNYQAILRNSDGTIRANEPVFLQISIVDDQGFSNYLEIHNTQTNERGLFKVEVGNGITTDDLSNVNWANGPYFLEITVNEQPIGSSPILSVPYALYATAGNVGPPGPQGEPGDSYWDEAGGNISYTDGKVGIGTDSPQSNLHTHGSPVPSKGQFIISAPSGQDIQYSFMEGSVVRAFMWWDSDTRKLTVQNNNLDDLNLNPFGGKVGIRTSSPSEVLDVNGNLNVTGSILINNTEPVLTESQVYDILKDLRLLPRNFAGTVTDIDGNKYKSVQIGSQIWMEDNLRATHFNDGTPLGNINNPADTNQYQHYYSWYDDDSIYNKYVFGAFYNVGIELSDQNICPAGWHISTSEDWDILESFIGIPAGGKLKEAGTSKWLAPNTGATNETSFSALPGGRSVFYDSSLQYLDIGKYGLWHAVPYSGTPGGNYRVLTFDSTELITPTSIEDYDKFLLEINAASIRCVKD